MADFEGFLAAWDAPAGEVERVEIFATPFGNLNSTGELGNYRGPALSPRHPQFEAALEPGVRRLVMLLVNDFGWVTYTSCQGHRYPGGLPAPVERHVGLAPRSGEEFLRIAGTLDRVCAATNRRLRGTAVQLEVVQLTIESDGRRFPVMDLFFRRRRLASWRSYFAELDRVYVAALAELEASASAEALHPRAPAAAGWWPWVSRAYDRWRVRRWVAGRGREDAYFQEDDGRTRRLREMVDGATSARASVSRLWAIHREERVWGEHLPTLQQAAEAVIAEGWRRAPTGVLLRAADLSGSWTDHLARIALFVRLLERGVKLPPMVMGLDGTLWDGFHRLVACHVASAQEVGAIQILTPGADPSR